VIVSQIQPSEEPAVAVHDVEVRITAAPSHLSVVRAVAVDIAMRQDFDLDEISDFKLAVDEACSTLVALAVPEAVLSCRFHARDGEVQVHTTVLSAQATGARQDTFGWKVLTTLTDSASSRVEQAAADPGGYLVHIELVKKSGRVVGR
jgi:serine/threonine-protein kinase RsbW